MNKNAIVSLLLICAALLIHDLGGFQSWMGIDQAQGISMTILVITAVLWITEAFPLYVTSFVVVLLQVVWLLPAVNGGRAPGEELGSEVFLSPFFSDIILLFLGGFVLSAALHKYGLDQRIARWLLGRTGNKPSRVLLGIMAVSAALSMWMSNTATAAMMLAIVLPIIARIPGPHPFTKALALAIPFACNLGGIGTPIGSPPNAIAMTYLKEAGIRLTFGEWVGATLPFLAVLLVFLWFLLLKLFPPGDLELSIESKESDGIGPKHWTVIGVFLATCLGWLTTGIHPYSTGTVSLIPIIVCFGFRLLDTEDFRSLSWDILFMLGGGLCLGVGLRESGLSDSIVSMIPTEGGMTFLLFGVLAALMTTFMSNTATANLLIPIAFSLEGAVADLVVVVAIICSTAMVLPVSTPPNAIAFGSGMLKSKDLVLPGLIITLFAGLVVILLAPSYWRVLGIF